MSTDKMTIPGWYKEVLNMTESERKSLVAEILKAVAMDGSKNDRATVSGQKLVTYIRREFDLVGFCPNVWYGKASGSKNDLRDTFIHKWGYPTLLYKHKTLPFTMQVNPGMRKDKMLLTEIPGNRGLYEGVYVVGLTQ